MPLKQDSSESSKSHNLKKLLKEKYPKKQALAIVLNISRKRKKNEKRR